MQPLNLTTYRWVLLVHSDFRWVVLIAGFAAVMNAALGLAAQQPWAPLGPRLSRLFSIALDIQVLLGAALYLVLSPLTTIVASAGGARLPRASDAYFFSTVHPSLMIGAFIAVHISSVLVRRASHDAAHQRRAALFYGVTLLIVMSGIPWWRPWLRW